MDISHNDFNKLLTRVDTLYDMLEWQTPSDIAVVNRMAEEVRLIRKLLRSYRADDAESTTAEQLELMFPPEDLEDEGGYGNY